MSNQAPEPPERIQILTTEYVRADLYKTLEARLERLEKAFSTSNKRYWKDVYNQQPEEG